MPHFHYFATSLIQTEVASENDWHLQRKFYLADTNYILKMYPPFVTQKVEPKCAARRNLWGRHLSSVKRLLRTFEAIKRSSFLNPPTACRPISPNFAVRDRLTRGNNSKSRRSSENVA